MTDNWNPIDTAPKDGTVIRVRNPMIAKWETPYVDVKWGNHQGILGNKVTKQWILVKDYCFLPLRAGTLVIPDEWQRI